MGYTETRRQCLDELQNILLTRDAQWQTSHASSTVMGPEQKFECGEQQGGNNGCSGCSRDLRRYCDLTYCLRSPHLSLADRIKIVQAGPAGRMKRNGGIRPYKNTTVAELRAEWLATGLNDEGLKTDLLQNVKEQLKGVQRVPALLINEQDKSMEDINLGTESLTNDIF